MFAEEERLRQEEARRKFEEERLKAAMEAEVKPQIAREAEVKAIPELEDIRFDFDKSDIRADAKDILQKNAEWLQKNPDVKIQIEGHCDERGTAEYNLALGDRRAMSTKKYLTSLGVSAERIYTISYGEELPIDAGHNEEAWIKNRRGHFLVIVK
ncbi:MAG: peptidoglycan-associated lipoprotein Pal [Nitrospinae bacterium]|nr:peptidoglycan-associated lipoprotein Pal [Nitrospinota bacterium]MBI3813082.1 peptidoglycan-associated lipoprotein Pal [Nitrospinota bacterium]